MTAARQVVTGDDASDVRLPRSLDFKWLLGLLAALVAGGFWAGAAVTSLGADIRDHGRRIDKLEQALESLPAAAERIERAAARIERRSAAMEAPR